MNFESPYELLYNKLPDYTYLKAFECLCYIANVYSTFDKLNSRGLTYVFLGYPFGKKGYRVMYFDTKKCYISRDIIFIEYLFPFNASNAKSPMHTPLLTGDIHYIDTLVHIPTVTSD